MDHQNNFNLLRLLAAVEVVYVHGIDHLNLPWNWTYFGIIQFPGVPCFFIISGFLVTGSFLNSSISSFAWKRAKRIYPGLIVNILMLELLVAIGGSLTIVSATAYFGVYLPAYLVTASSWLATSASQFVAGYNAAPVYGGGFFNTYPSGVLWSLSVELSFYAVLPLFLLIVKQSRVIGSAIISGAMGASLLLSLSLAEPLNGTHPLLDITVVRYFWIFGLGILARIFWPELRNFFEGRFLIWLLLYATSTVAVYFISGLHFIFISPQHADEPIRMILLSGTILSAAYSFRSLTSLLRLDKVDFSYGLYLYHVLFIDIISSLGFKGDWWLWPVVYAGAFAIAATSWFLIEKPVHSFKFFARKDRTIGAKVTLG